MNKEIMKKLSAQASAYANTNAGKDLDEVQELYQTKLVELIVTECADLCENFKFADEGPSEGAAYQRALCSIAIKEHFGLVSRGPISHKVIR